MKNLVHNIESDVVYTNLRELFGYLIDLKSNNKYCYERFYSLEIFSSRFQNLENCEYRRAEKLKLINIFQP